jgi:hypothetical protein
MNRVTALTIRVCAGMDIKDPKYAPFKDLCGIEWATDLETSGHPNCRKPIGEPTSLPDGKGYQVFWVGNPTIEFYRLLFTDFPEALPLSNMRVYCDGHPLREEILLTEKNYLDHIEKLAFWYMESKIEQEPI